MTSLRDASRRTGIPPSTLAHWVRRGLIRHQPPPRRGLPARIYLADVLALAPQHRGPGRGHGPRLP